MELPIGLLSTLAQSSVAYAGLSALALVVVQLAGVKWQAQMTTGLWLLIAWSLGAFVFSIFPILLAEFKIAAETIISVASFGLGIFIAVVILSALRRDTRILKLGAIGTARPPVYTMITIGTISTLSSVSQILNAFSLLPGPRQAWYCAGIGTLFLFAIAPLVHLVAAVQLEE